MARLAITHACVHAVLLAVLGALFDFMQQALHAAHGWQKFAEVNAKEYSLFTRYATNFCEILPALRAVS